MRTKLLLLALALGAVPAAGCSLVYNGTHYQGGTATDSGPGGTDSGTLVDGGLDAGNDAGVDSGSGDDGGTACHDIPSCPVMGTYCDSVSMTCKLGCDDNSDCAAGSSCNTATHQCGTAACTTSADCAGDNFCNASVCTPCDADGDHFYAAAAGLGCARPTHLNGGDCDDGNASVYPFARADCSTTTIAESCPLPIAFMPILPDPLIVHETGVTPVQTLWTETGALHVMDRDPIFAVIGDDSPQLPSGAVNGFIGFVANDAAMRTVQAVPITWDGTTRPAEPLFTGFHVGAASFRHTRSMVGDAITLAAAGFDGQSDVVLMSGQLGHPPQAFGPALLFTTTAPILGGLGGFPSVAAFTSVGLPAGVVATHGSAGMPTLQSFDITGGGLETGPASIVPGTWLVASGAASMWAANTSQVGVWNGADSAVPTPTIDLSAFTAVSPPRLVLPSFRGAMDSRPMSGGGGERFIAAIPVGTTATPPTGRIALARWSAPFPSAGDPTSLHVPAEVVVSELDLGAGAHLAGATGLAVVMIDDATAVIGYQDGGDIVVRLVPVAADSTRPSPENPPSMKVMTLGVGEAFTSISIAGGAYFDMAAGTGVGRLGIAAMVSRSGGTHEIRARALEACIGP